MKPSLIALCVAACAAPGVASSQVALSGILDLAARSTSNEGVGSYRALTSGSNSTSRLIFSGREDLGDGLFASFHLEHGIAADTGLPAAADKFWDRRSTVSLGHRAWGELRAGRDFVPSYTGWSRYDPFSYVGAARSANVVSATPVGPIRSAFGTSANTTVRADNALQFLLPASPGGLSGLEGAVLLAPGEGREVASGRAKVTGLRLGWSGKDWGVSAGRTTSQNSLTGSNRFADTVVGGQVDALGLRFTAAWRKFSYLATDQTLTMLGVVWTSGAHEVKGSVVRSNHAGRVGATVVDANDAQQIGLGYVHNLSRRTALYATVAQLSNDGAARFTLTDGPPGMAGGGTSRGYEIGVRHRF